jgi:parvulin-like peptidyl-prolyl isomerase
MTTGLRIGDRVLPPNQLITALIQYKLMDALIGQVLLDEAIQAIAISPEEVWQWVTRSTVTPPPEQIEAALAQWCADQGITSTYFEAVVLREWRVEKFKQQYFADHLESEFLHTKAWFDQVVYSLVQVNDAALALELYYQVRDDSVPFAALAAYSAGSEREAAGYVGPVPLATVPTELRPLLQPGQEGLVQKPRPIGDRYWVVRLEQFIPARLTESTRHTLTNRLFDHWLQAKVAALRSIPDAIAVHVADT